MNKPIPMNVTRAREVLISPDSPWTPEVKQALAQAYIDHTQALALLNSQIDTLERELTELGNLHRAACDELAETKAILRGLYP